MEEHTSPRNLVLLREDEVFEDMLTASRCPVCKLGILIIRRRDASITARGEGWAHLGQRLGWDEGIKFENFCHLAHSRARATRAAVDERPDAVALRAYFT